MRASNLGEAMKAAGFGISAPAQSETKITLGYLVREALEEVDGNVEKATSRLYYQLRNDKTLLEKVIKEAIHYAVSERTQHTVRSDRVSIVRNANNCIEQARAEPTVNRDLDKRRVVALAEAISSSLLDMPLAGGKLLRHATRDDLLSQIDRYDKLAGSMMHKSRWLTLVLKGLPEGKRVGSVMTEKRALELFEEAKPVSEGHAA